VTCGLLKTTEEQSHTYTRLLLDQLVTIDYNAGNFEFAESVPPALIDELLTKVILIFQPNGNLNKKTDHSQVGMKAAWTAWNKNGEVVKIEGLR